MSYEKEIEQNAKDAVVLSRYEDLFEYLNKLNEEIDALMLRSKASMKIDIGIFVAMFATAFFAVALWPITMLLFMFYTAYCHSSIDRPISRKMGQVIGAMDALSLLGLAPGMDDIDGGKKRKVKMEKEGVIEKMWNAIKNKKRTEGYA